MGFHATPLPPPVPHRIRVGSYLTDEIHLYRIERIAGGEVTLEDCMDGEPSGITLNAALSLRTVCAVAA